MSQQLRRASVSIPSNIAEGSARKSKKEFLHYLTIDLGSATEVATQALIAKRLGYVDNDLYISIYKETDEIGRMITGLRKSILSKSE